MQILTRPQPPAQLCELSSLQLLAPAPGPAQAVRSFSALQAESALQVREHQQQLPEGTCAVDCITEVQDLAHLERRLDQAGSSVVCLALYSRSCGACKEMLQHQQQLCRDAGQQLAGAVFLKHNVRDAFDDLTDISRFYRVRSVPTFVFMVGGAPVSPSLQTGLGCQLIHMCNDFAFHCHLPRSLCVCRPPHGAVSAWSLVMVPRTVLSLWYTTCDACWAED